MIKIAFINKLCHATSVTSLFVSLVIIITGSIN